MAIAVKPKKQFEYVLLEDRQLPEAEQTTWMLRALTVGEQAELQDSLRTERLDTGETSWKTGTLLLKTLRAGLVGVKGFREEGGVEVSFEKVNGVVSDTFLDRLAPAWRNELSNAIVSAGRLEPKERD